MLREELSEKFKGANNVSFRNFLPRKDVYRIMRAADALILASTYEPHGAVVREAYANGLKVICSDNVGARLDLVSKLDPTLIFNSRDRTDIATKILTVLFSKENSLQEMVDLISKQGTKKVSEDLISFFTTGPNNG